jgi:glycosyltransferase involved in cell wall biosynthesis
MPFPIRLPRKRRTSSQRWGTSSTRRSAESHPCVVLSAGDPLSEPSINREAARTSPAVAESAIEPGIAVVIPIRDDRDGAIAVLDALAAQTQPPDEVIIVNDGSIDGTRALLEARQASPLAYRIVDANGVGRAAARNLGISAARHEWIACTDAGCVPIPGWLEAIQQASNDSDFVAGVVVVDAESPLERIFALSVFPRDDEFDDPPRWIRASHRLFGRSISADRIGGGYMAFRRAVWESVGGFPPGLRASDDRAFTTAVAHAGFRIVRARGAEVHWRPRATLLANLQMFFNYSRGDVRIRPRRRHLVRVVAYGGATLVLTRGSSPARAALACSGLAYVWLPLHRARGDRLPFRHWWRIPAVIALKDLAQIAGATMGVVDAASRCGRAAEPGEASC